MKKTILWLIILFFALLFFIHKQKQLIAESIASTDCLSTPTPMPLQECVNVIGPPENTCCEGSTSCNNVPHCNTLPAWSFCYGTCIQTYDWISNQCKYVYKYMYTKCSIADSCITSYPKKLIAGMCNDESGCTKGGDYKICCQLDDNGNLTDQVCSQSCRGANFNGTCPPGCGAFIGSSCPTPTSPPSHLECLGNTCTKVTGPGNNSCSSEGATCFAFWGTCNTNCGTGEKKCECSGECTQGCWCNGGYSCNQTSACTDCNGCENICTDCNNQCGTNYCGNKTVTGKKNCHKTGCESDCFFNCPCQECETCSPACGQAKNCGGNCSDYRSGSLTMGNSFVHDMPISISGFARDDNGDTDGVENVNIYNGSGFWTSFSENGIIINANNGSFSGNILTNKTADLYTAGERNGLNHSYTLNFLAVQTENNVCPNWNFAQKNITLTNQLPYSPQLVFKKTDNTIICQDDSCNNIPLLSYTINNVLRINLSVKDSDPFPTSPTNFQRGSDIEKLVIVFDDDNNLSNGYFYKLKYVDAANNSYSLEEDGGSYAESINLLTDHSRNYSDPKFTITFDLDFKNFPQSQNFNSNVYVYAQDFAGGQINQQIISGVTLYPPYWYKLKNASLMKISSLTNYLASSPQQYDVDDNSQRYLIIGEPGVVLSEGNITLGGIVNSLVSSKGWYSVSYQKQRNFFVNQYIEYARSRKAIKIITNPNEIEANKINLLKSGDVTINSSNQFLFEKDNSVIIIRNSNNTNFAKLTFNLQNFNTSFPPHSLAIIANKITFNDQTQEINGIFLASSFQLASEPSPHYTPNPLKIIGNLSSFNEIVDTTVRRRNDVNKPSIFIVFSPKMYLDLLPYLSISKYDWRQLQ
ncbi:MAG: hypothetical protein N2558_04870 [Patescibacteria group bacterium]|nr:hypothetical protein [Patescibacteria group bacterium]